MFRDPDAALDNLHTLAVQINDNMAMSRLGNGTEQTLELDTHLHNLTAQLVTQFQWLDEYLSSHGTIPGDWRSACHRPYGQPRSSDGEVSA